jgi:hypothetical protein
MINHLNFQITQHVILYYLAAATWRNGLKARALSGNRALIIYSFF